MIEAFARLIASRPDIRGGGFRAYLYKTARRLALRLLARRWARQTFSLDEPGGGAGGPRAGGAGRTDVPHH